VKVKDAAPAALAVAVSVWVLTPAIFKVMTLLAFATPPLMITVTD